MRWEGREKKHYLNAVPIAEIGRRWIDKFSRQRAEAEDGATSEPAAEG